MLENLLESYYQTRVNKFSEFISYITGMLMKLLYYTFFQTPGNTNIFRELLANNTHFQSLYQAILTFSEFLPN